MFTNFIFKDYINGSKLITKKVTRQLIISRGIEPSIIIILMGPFTLLPRLFAIGFISVLFRYFLYLLALLYNEMSGNSVFRLAYANTEYGRTTVYNGVEKSFIDIIYADGYYKKVELVETIQKPLNNRQKFSDEFSLKGYRLNLYDKVK